MKMAEGWRCVRRVGVAAASRVEMAGEWGW